MLECIDVILSVKVGRYGIFQVIVPRLSLKPEIAPSIGTSAPDDFPVVLPNDILRIFVYENLRFFSR